MLEGVSWPVRKKKNHLHFLLAFCQASVAFHMWEAEWWRQFQLFSEVQRSTDRITDWMTSDINSLIVSHIQILSPKAQDTTTKTQLFLIFTLPTCPGKLSSYHTGGEGTLALPYSFLLSLQIKQHLKTMLASLYYHWLRDKK